MTPTELDEAAEAADALAGWDLLWVLIAACLFLLTWPYWWWKCRAERVHREAARK